MTDPYSVLGVPRSASNDDIKKAYRQLSRKYHPDANINNPNKEAAEARFKEVQLAYDQIMNERNGGASGGYDSYGTGQGGYSYGPFSGGPFGYGYGSGQQQSYDDEDTLKYQAAVNYINSGSYQEALHVLDGITNRTAQWYYLCALTNLRMGNNINAQELARKAVEMEPGNFQYRQLLTQLENGGQWYQETGRGFGMPAMNFGDACWKLVCLNLACNCFCPGACCYI